MTDIVAWLSPLLANKPVNRPNAPKVNVADGGATRLVGLIVARKGETLAADGSPWVAPDQPVA